MPEKQDSVSVIIPTHNRPEFLAIALKSVLSQTLLPGEIIVVDDGSRISAEPIVDEFNVSTIRYLRNPQPTGASAARNRGLERAKGEFVAFLDDDDQWYPEKLQKQMTHYESCNQDVAGVFCYSVQQSPLDPGWRLESRTPALELGFSDFLQKSYFGTSIPLLRRYDVEQVDGFDESLVSVQDRDLWLRLSRERVFVGIPEFLASRSIHGSQITTDLARKIKGREQFIAKYLDELRQYPETLYRHYWRLGLMYCLQSNEREARENLELAISTNENNKGALSDLRALEIDPEAHRSHLENERFPGVGHVKLYY